MKPGEYSKKLLGATRSKGKMFEYLIPPEHHIELPKSPARLFSLSIGILGDLAAAINEVGPDDPRILELSKDLKFAAYFFDAFLQSKIEPEVDQYVCLLAAASYYLCNYPGSAQVVTAKLSDQINLDVQGLDKVLFSILTGKFGETFGGNYGDKISRLFSIVDRFLKTGILSEDFDIALACLRKEAYRRGTPRELLLADISCALLKIKIQNTTWSILPSTTQISLNDWKEVILKNSFIKELWPAQKLLAHSGVFNGKSAVVQMPTSAGKTRSIEIAIRAAFMKGRTNLAVLVMPFRALCHEVRDDLKRAFLGEEISIDELTDVFQDDFEAGEVLRSNDKQVLVVTPEKLIYVLRQTPDLAKQIGLLILDEGHQFDSGLRGVSYELLVSSLKPLIPDSAQKILISAVISNAEAINKWLNGDHGAVVKGDQLNTTYRTVGFATWSTTLGQIKYVEHPNIDNDEFFVPRVIESFKLARKGRERKDRFFPVRGEGSSVSLYLGLKLVQNGSVAVFCGLKTTVQKLCEALVEAHERGLPNSAPSRCSDSSELEKIANLYSKNLGESALEVSAAKIGILTHHAAIPHGLRLCVEYAMRKELAKFVLCTSTLAQGVNLPIRYLIFTSIYQAGEKIKVRDFHNLIGRAGRSGMYTEGSILFGDPDVYDGKRKRGESWKWRSVRELIEPTNSEPCASSLLSLFDPIYNASEELFLKDFSVISMLEAYLSDPVSLAELIQEIVDEHGENEFDSKTLRRQFDYKIRILSSIESYLLSSACDVVLEDRPQYVENLAKDTLAYSLASAEVKEQLVRAFSLTSIAIEKSEFTQEKRKAFGKTLLGLTAIKDIESWIASNISKIFEAAEDENQIAECLWPIIEKYIGNSEFRKLHPASSRFTLVSSWLNGASFEAIYEGLQAESAYIKAGTKKRLLKVQSVVEMCESGLAYDGMLLFGAIAEILETWPTTESDVWGSENISFKDTLLPSMIRNLQKRMSVSQ